MIYIYYIEASVTLGFMLFVFVRQTLPDECVKRETQGHRHYYVIYIYIYVYMCVRVCVCVQLDSYLSF